MPIGLGFGWLFMGSGSGDSGGVIGTPPRRVLTTLWINNTPLEWYGLRLQRPTGWLDGVSRALPETLRVPALTGGRYELLPVSAARDVTLTAVLLDIPLEQQQAGLAALSDALSGLLELRWPHAPNSVMRGVAGPLIPTPINPDKAFVNPDRTALQVSVTIRCVDGVTYARQPRRIRLSTVPQPIVMRGLPVGGEMLLEGPLSGSVNIDYLAANGGLLERDALRGVSLASGDSLTIRRDVPHSLIKRTAAGAFSNVYAWRSLSESTRWWKANPIHADAARGQWPYVRLSTGSGWWTYLNGDAA